MPKFPVKKGFYGFADDSEAFLRPDGPAGTDPYKADDFSTVGYNASKNDNAGTRDYAGHGDDSFGQDWREGSVAAQNDSFLRPSSVGDIDDVNANHGYLIDNDPSLPSNKLIAGGGALSQKGGIGAGPPRHAPKNVGHAGQKNWDSRGGVNKAGTRR